MIETQGGLIPFVCHLFLIAFTGFFDLSALFNGKKLAQKFGFSRDQDQVGARLGLLVWRLQRFV
tara:strand:+ start:544 stop:735 length:192 start_codon:yes stop_codon:yes gene_type:complete